MRNQSRLWRLMTLTLISSLLFCADVQAQRRGGGTGGPGGGGAGGGRGPSGGASGGRNAGGRSGGASGFSGGMNRGGQGSAGPRASSGRSAQPGGSNAAQRTPGNNNFQQSIDHIRSNGNGNATGNRAAATRDNRTAADRSPNDPVQNRNNGNQAFSAAWYADHPQAWQAANPHADAYAVAAAPNMRSWWAYPATGAVPVGVPVATAPVGVPATGAVPAQTSAASTENSDKTAENQGEWLPIGVFNLSKKGSSETTRAVQLATNHKGEIKGNQVDLLTDAVAEVQGRFDEKSNKLQWTVGNSNNVVFKAKLDSFQKTSQPVPLEVVYADGTESEWVMTAVDQSANDDKTSE